MWAVFVCAICAVHISSAQIPWFVDSYEGSACNTPTGAPGVCKERDDCLVTLPSPVPVSEDADGRALCGTVGPNALVCCDSRPASDVTSTTTTPSPDVVTTRAPPVVTSTELPRTPVGEKSAKYCLSIISYNKQPWWIDEDESSQGNNEVTPWWEEKKQLSTRKQLVFWVNGGVESAPKEFPHMALLGYRLPGQTNTKWSCGGALISDRFVLTAAHCLRGADIKNHALVRLGEYDLIEDDRTEQDFGIDRVWLHPKDGPGVWYHDIALIRLSRTVTFTRAISPACLYSSPEGQERTDGLVVSGWGRSANDPSFSRVLLRGSAPLRVVPRNECAKYYRLATHQVPKGIHPGMVCAVDRTKYVDTCEGDSGGPIQLKTTFDVYAIVGVTTGGTGLCGDGVPSIYTRVAFYLDWIESIVWPNGLE